MPLICKPCRSFAVNPSTLWQEVVLNDGVQSELLRLPNLFYSWFNHHGVAIKHLTLKDTVSFEGACLKIDNIPGVPLIPPARRGGVTFPAVDTCNAAANSHQFLEAAEASESTEMRNHEPARQSPAANRLGEPDFAHE